MSGRTIDGRLSFVEAFGHYPTMTKPATNAELPGAFLVYQL